VTSTSGHTSVLLRLVYGKAFQSQALPLVDITMRNYECRHHAHHLCGVLMLREW
jgi:hypothetical protein